MTTIKDIAKYCNVSVSTVSYALNDNSNGTISKKTIDRIKQAAKELDYIPNFHAKGLKRKKTNIIGVFVPGFQGVIHPRVLSGIAYILREHKYNMLVALTDEQMKIINYGTVDLAIIMNPKISNDVVIDLSKKMPIITFDKIVQSPNIYNTYVKNKDAIIHVTNLLISKGCNKIGFLLGSRDSIHNELRFQGYIEALNQANIPIDDNIIYDADAFTEFKGHEIISKSINPATNLPFEALICCNDELAFGAMKALSEKGFNCPNDYLLTGFDDIEKSAFVTPSLTTVNVDWFNYGKKLGNLVLDILQNANYEDSFTIDTNIIERESTSKY